MTKCPHKNTKPMIAFTAWGDPIEYGKCLDCKETLM